jgi:hypothetical protein
MAAGKDALAEKRETMTSSNYEQERGNPDRVVLSPGSEQFPAPRHSDPPAICNQCGARMMFNAAYLADSGTWTCNCEAGWAQQKRQLKWFIIIIFVLLMIAGMAV